MSTTTNGSEPDVTVDERIVADAESEAIHGAVVGDVAANDADQRDGAVRDGDTVEGPAIDGTEGAEVSETGNVQVRRSRWKQVVGYGVLPVLVLILALGAGYFKWQGGEARQSQTARLQSVQAATESTIALLSYRAESVEKDLDAARDRLTGSFRDDYAKLINDVVIPGAKQKHITAVANVPGVAAVSASDGHAVVLVFVNQTVTVGNDPPTSTASSVLVTLDKVGNRWLISQFDPV